MQIFSKDCKKKFAPAAGVAAPPGPFAPGALSTSPPALAYWLQAWVASFCVRYRELSHPEGVAEVWHPHPSGGTVPINSSWHPCSFVDWGCPLPCWGCWPLLQSMLCWPIFLMFAKERDLPVDMFCLWRDVHWWNRSSSSQSYSWTLFCGNGGHPTCFNWIQLLYESTSVHTLQPEAQRLDSHPSGPAPLYCNHSPPYKGRGWEEDYGGYSYPKVLPMINIHPSWRVL